MDCLICIPHRKVLYGKHIDKSRVIVSLSKRITSSLYNKYAESQNYYYTKVVNDLIINQPTKMTIQFKDLQQYDEDEEYCKKLYKLQSYPKKIKILIEFYRFHKEIPRWAVNEKIVGILNEFYNQKRKLDYYKIQHIVQMENQQNPSKTPKGIVGEQPRESESTPPSSGNSGVVVGNVLDELQAELKQRNQTRQSDIEEILASLNQQSHQKSQKIQNLIDNQQFILNEYRLQQLLTQDKMKKMKQLINNQKNQPPISVRQTPKPNFDFKIVQTSKCKSNGQSKNDNSSNRRHTEILHLLKQRVQVKLEQKLKLRTNTITNNTSLKSFQKNQYLPKTPRNIQLQTQQSSRQSTKKQIKAKTFHVDQSSKNLIITLLSNKNSTVHFNESQKSQLLAKLYTLNTPRVRDQKQ